MKHIGDVLLEAPATDDQIASAMAEAFGVNRVTVWPMAQVADTSADILVERDSQPGEFPFALTLVATPKSGLGSLDDAQVVDMLRALAHRLGQFILTDAAGINPVFDDDFLLVSPNGDAIVVQVTFDGLRRGEIELTPASRARRARLMAAPLAG
jgi:hypothetical protein